MDGAIHDKRDHFADDMRASSPRPRDPQGEGCSPATKLQKLGEGGVSYPDADTRVTLTDAADVARSTSAFVKKFSQELSRTARS